jgi:lipopolysaccharide export system permease protein
MNCTGPHYGETGIESKFVVACRICIAPNTLGPMRLLDRYLFRELLMPLTYCVSGFLIFWVSFELFGRLDDLQSAKLHLLDVLELCIAWAPDCLVTALPIALLLGLLYTLSHHSRYNEITAMRAAGISLWRICMPYFVVGFLLSLALFALNEYGVPKSSDWADGILQRYVPKQETVPENRMHGFQTDRAHRTWLFADDDLQIPRLDRVQVNWILPDDSSRQLNADHAVRTNGVWTFYAVTEYIQHRPGGPFFNLLQTNVLAMPEFTETPADIARELHFSRYEGIQSLRLDLPLSELWPYLRAHPNLPRAKASEWWTKFHGRLAEPWTCLVVVLIAIPFGAASGRRNLFFGVAGSIFICFAFFVVQKVSLAVGAGGHMPPWLAAWLPNLVFGAVGIFLTARVR